MRVCQFRHFGTVQLPIENLSSPAGCWTAAVVSLAKAAGNVKPWRLPREAQSCLSRWTVPVDCGLETARTCRISSFRHRSTPSSKCLRIRCVTEMLQREERAWNDGDKRRNAAPLLQADAKEIRRITHDMNNALEILVQASYLVNTTAFSDQAREWMKLLD